MEEVHEEEKAKATRMQHFAMALGRPFIKKGGTMCHLNVEVGQGCWYIVESALVTCILEGY